MDEAVARYRRAVDYLAAAQIYLKANHEGEAAEIVLAGCGDKRRLPGCFEGGGEDFFEEVAGEVGADPGDRFCGIRF